LGELFDHGCDSITMGMIALVTAGAVRLGGVLTLTGLIIGWGPFYLAHWEEYHTGILIMGKFNGPTEAQLIVIGISLSNILWDKISF
jgi:ethanolaminephosphotransferase